MRTHSSEMLSSRWPASPACADHRQGASPSQPSPLEGLLSPSAGAAGAVTLLPAQALNPARAGAGGEARERQGAEPHVFARHDELPEALLVGEGIAGAPGTRATHPPHAAVLGLLLLPHQLGVADLAGEARGKEPPSAWQRQTLPQGRAPECLGWGRHGHLQDCPGCLNPPSTHLTETAATGVFKPKGFQTHELHPPKQTGWPLTVSERSGFRFSLRNRKATTGMMQTTVVSTMVSHTVGWARVFWALPGNKGVRGLGSHKAGARAAPPR